MPGQRAMDLFDAGATVFAEQHYVFLPLQGVAVGGYITENRVFIPTIVAF